MGSLTSILPIAQPVVKISESHLSTRAIIVDSNKDGYIYTKKTFTVKCRANKRTPFSPKVTMATGLAMWSGDIKELATRIRSAQVDVQVQTGDVSTESVNTDTSPFLHLNNSFLTLGIFSFLLKEKHTCEHLAWQMTCLWCSVVAEYHARPHVHIKRNSP